MRGLEEDSDEWTVVTDHGGSDCCKWNIWKAMSAYATDIHRWPENIVNDSDIRARYNTIGATVDHSAALLAGMLRDGDAPMYTNF